MNRDKNGKIMSYLKITEVVLIHFYVVSNYYHQDSRVLYTFVPNKFAELLDISPVKISLKTLNSEFSYIEAWFTNQNSKSLDIEDKLDVTLAIN